MCFSSFQFILTLFVFLCVIFGTNSCFIRNCPKGGKRGMDETSQIGHKCMSCGPGNVGQCVGPTICCGSFGCYIGTKETKVCQHENESTVPCRVDGKLCGSHQQGKCVADGICCDSEACSQNPKCEEEEDEADERPREKILHLLQRILEEKSFH